jgi:hypothetical protein
MREFDKNQDGKRNLEICQTKKGNQYYGCGAGSLMMSSENDTL